MHEMDLRLRDSENSKFARPGGGTNRETLRTYSPDEVMGLIVDANYAFLPIAVGPFGNIGRVFVRFWNSTLAWKFNESDFKEDRPNAAIATNYGQASWCHKT